MNLTVVLPNGEVIKTKQRARKSSTGFDTTKLFVGAEGTLGVVTEGMPVLKSDLVWHLIPALQRLSAWPRCCQLRLRWPNSRTLGMRSVPYRRSCSRRMAAMSVSLEKVRTNHADTHVTECVELLDDNSALLNFRILSYHG